MKKLILLLIGLILILLVSCSDNNGPTKVYERYVYYSLSAADGNNVDACGLWIYQVGARKLTRLVNESVSFVSGVSAGGAIVYELENLTSYYWQRDESGNFAQLPFPESQTQGLVYERRFLPHINMDYSGNTVAYFITLKPDTLPGSEDRLTYLPKLVVYSRNQTKFDMFDLRDITLNSMKDIDANYAEPYGASMLMNASGSSIWFVMKGIHYTGNPSDAERYIVVQWANKELKVVGSEFDVPVELCGIDIKENKIYLKKEGKIYLLNSSGGLEDTYLVDENVSSPEQFLKTQSVLAEWSNYGIEIKSPDGEATPKRLVTWEGLGNNFLFNPDKKMAVAPDGAWVVFTVPSISVSGMWDLCIVDQEGKNFDKIVEHIKIGGLTFSGELEVK